MNRGDLSSAVMPGDYGSKPRPVLVIQSDLFHRHDSITVLPLTTFIDDTPFFRVTIEPSKENGLLARSQIMADKAHTLPRRKMGYVFGRVAHTELLAVDRALALFLGLS